ncbi:hypothetical protein DDI_2693 [Dickeya dianthicola RNS04.9]|nr:hypothetical protein DDI_2693 [Dickeya dianthicola RNS04.9]
MQQSSRLSAAFLLPERLTRRWAEIRRGEEEIILCKKQPQSALLSFV